MEVSLYSPSNCSRESLLVKELLIAMVYVCISGALPDQKNWGLGQFFVYVNKNIYMEYFLDYQILSSLRL